MRQSVFVVNTEHQCLAVCFSFIWREKEHRFRMNWRWHTEKQMFQMIFWPPPGRWRRKSEEGCGIILRRLIVVFWLRPGVPASSRDIPPAGR
jgi:hypothetical protein